jgi:hypothetical protein
MTVPTTTAVGMDSWAFDDWNPPFPDTNIAQSLKWFVFPVAMVRPCETETVTW